MKRERWRKSFSEWFNGILRSADIMDTRYPVKGLYVWLPYGLKLRNQVFGVIRQLLEQTGHQEVLFPLLIPEDIFKKEAEHIRGFEGEVYWVTHGGLDKLDVKLALRPTSETSIYPMFALWVRSHADLPIRVYQIVNIFRYETKMTKPMIRLREVTTFKEAHTAHATWDEAEAQVREAVKIYKRFFDELGVPYIVTRRPPWDTFAGAKYSLAFDTLAPDGRTLQIGTAHNLGQNFAKVYELKFETPDGKHEYVYQTCYGISERVIAAVMMVHGDDAGLCMPPTVAPIQVVVVPIPFKSKEAPVQQIAAAATNELVTAGIKAHLDDRDLRPGRKFYHWERRGVPLRLEIGPEDIEKDQVTAVRRDTGERQAIPRRALRNKVRELLEAIDGDLRERAWKFFKEMTHEASDVGTIKQLMDRRGGIVRVPWCGEEKCGLELEEKTGGDILGQELDGKPATGVCPICSKRAKLNILVTRTY
ncbi:MAG: proline--tRNA ligase [Candidatus Hodarchaeaceae archaeon]|nr:proline--tRNA ligase [Candidatus Hodarchaeaceae archaeon]